MEREHLYRTCICLPAKDWATLKKLAIKRNYTSTAQLVRELLAKEIKRAKV